MKNVIAKCIILLVLCGVCFSCEKEEFYSCNPAADQWVKENLKEVQTMTRTEWANIGDIVYQKAAFSAFTAQQRYELWIRKFDEVLALNLTKQERHHVLLLREQIKKSPQWFDDDVVEKYRDQMDLFTYKWIEVAKNNLNWTNQYIYLLIGTPEIVNKDIKGNMVIATVHSIKVKTRGEGYGDVCNCGNDSEYLACPGISHQCKVTNKCTVTEKGCGVLWMNVCWGKCEPYK